jgi:hypothetical protein
LWRHHNLARTGWALDDQAYAIQALLSGFMLAATTKPVLESVAKRDD